MTKTRRLTDLFVVGQEVVIDDGNFEPITVWLQKLNPVEHETAMRRASGARARVLSGKNEEEIEMAQDEAAQITREVWIEYLVSDALGKRISALEAELSAEEEWSENDYLQGLKDVWEATLEKALEEDPEDISARKVQEELDRFRQQLDERIEGERATLVKDFEAKHDEDLERRVVDRLLQTRADLAWLNEFRKCEVWLSTREPENHRKKYFHSREEVDELAHETLMKIMTAYQSLAVDPLEGKDSGATQTSSSSSVSPDQVETAGASGPEVANT